MGAIMAKLCSFVRRRELVPTAQMLDSWYPFAVFGMPSMLQRPGLIFLQWIYVQI